MVYVTVNSLQRMFVITVSSSAKADIIQKFLSLEAFKFFMELKYSYAYNYPWQYFFYVNFFFHLHLISWTRDEKELKSIKAQSKNSKTRKTKRKKYNGNEFFARELKKIFTR